MSQEEEKKMGLFRFTIISPLLSDDPRPLLTRFGDLAERIWTLPNGTLRQFSAATIEDWYYDYRKYGTELSQWFHQHAYRTSITWLQLFRPPWITC